MPDWAKVHTELRRPGVTLMLLWLEHKEEFPDGDSYTQFTVHYRAGRAPSARSSSWYRLGARPGTPLRRRRPLVASAILRAR